MKNVLNYIISFFLLILIGAYCYKLSSFPLLDLLKKFPLYLWLGIISFIIVNRIPHPYIAVNLSRFKVSVHESIHIMVALLFGKQVTESRTSHTSGGHMKYQGGITVPGVEMLISLAPYFLSYLAWALILLKDFTSSSIKNPLLFAIGFVWTFHLITFYEQSVGYYFRSRKHQSDISGGKHYSTYTAYLFILFMNIILNSLIVLNLTQPSLMDDFMKAPMYLRTLF